MPVRVQSFRGFLKVYGFTAYGLGFRVSGLWFLERFAKGSLKGCFDGPGFVTGPAGSSKGEPYLNEELRL